MIARQEPLLDAREPVLRAIVLALRTVAIATGVIAIVQRAAVVAAIERAAEGGRAAGDDVVERAALGRQQLPGVRWTYAGPAARTMSASSSTMSRASAALLARDQVIDGIARRVPELAGDVGVDRRRARTAVAEVLLNDRHRDAGFQEMRGVAVAERMDVRAFGHATLLHREDERFLETRRPDRADRWIVQRPGRPAPRRREHPQRIAMRPPVRAQAS